MRGLSADERLALQIVGTPGGGNVVSMDRMRLLAALSSLEERRCIVPHAEACTDPASCPFDGGPKMSHVYELGRIALRLPV